MRTPSKPTKEEFVTIRKIAARAIEMAIGSSFQGRDKLDWIMDVAAAHEEFPLRLDELLSANDGNFAHDVFGVARHLNRETCKLENCFVPRFTRREEAA